MKILIKVIFIILIFASFIILSDKIAINIIYKNSSPRHWVLKSIFQPDDQLIYSLKKNSRGKWGTEEFTEISVINNQGFRDIDIISAMTDKSKKNIFMIGDSNVFGHGISENAKTLPKMIEKNWNSNNQTKINVFNMGVSGYSPDQEYRLINNRIIQWHPNAIIWMLHMPNDLYNELFDRKWPIPSLYNYNDKKDELIPLDARLNWLYSKGILSQKIPYLADSLLFNKIFYYLSGIPFFSRKSPDIKVSLNAWGKLKMIKEINEIADLSEKKGFKLYIVFFPYKEYIEAKTPKKVIEAWEEIKNFAVDRKIDSLDLTEFIRNLNLVEKSEKTDKKLNSYNDLYFKTDPHLNEQGTEFVGGIIASQLSLIQK